MCKKPKWYNIDVIKQSACLAVNPVTVEHFAYLFNCTPVGRGLDYDGPDLKFYSLDCLGRNVLCLFSAHRYSNGLQYSSGVV